SVVNVELEESHTAIDDVIVVAFGQTTKEAFTGSAAVINADELSKHTTTNVADALVGSVAGLQMRGSSGAPGAGSGSINIRGRSTMYASTDPLIIVDGSPYTASLSNIAPSDIESVSVLKDAASAALYGARGASGVIIITTKRAKSQDAVVNVDMKWGVNSRSIQDYDVITNPAAYYEAYYTQLYNYASVSAGLDVVAANKWANENMINNLGYNVYDVPAGQLLIGMNGKLNPAAKLGRTYNYNGTDYYMTPDNWTDMAYGNAFRQEYTVSVNGGNDRSSFYASMGYLNEDGVIEYSSYDRINARLKADYQAKSWLKLGANVGFVHSTQKANPNMDTSHGSTNLMYYTSMIAPIYPVYVRVMENGKPVIKTDEYGNPAYDYGRATNDYYVRRGFLSTGNPLGSNRYNIDTNEGNQLSGTFTLDIAFTKWLSLNATSNVNWGQSNGTYYDNSYYGPKVGVNGELTKSSTTSFRTNNVQTLNFHKSFGEHDVNALIGHEYYMQTTKYLGALKNGGFSPDIPELSAFAKSVDSSSYTNRYNVEGFFGSAQYNYAQRYFVSASYRRDASSNFHPDHRWGNFWSVGAAWVIDNEAWFNAHWVDLLKLKVSYGQQGNDSIGSFMYMDTYYMTPSSETTMAPTFRNLGNPDITWETTGNLNAGLEFSLWNGRLAGEVDFYTKKTSNLLFWMSVPEALGVRGYYGNMGDIRNQGVEVQLSGTPVRTKLVEWTVNVNLAHNQTKILSLPADKIAENGGFPEGGEWFEVGKPLFNSFYAKFAGLNENGEATYWADADLIDPDTGTMNTSKPGKNYSYKTTVLNNASRYETGSLLPLLFGGFSTSLRVWRFDVSASFDYQIGGKIYDARYQSLMTPSTNGNGGENFHKDYTKAWTTENTSSNIPRWQYNDQYAAAESDRWLTDASYLNFQSFTVGFTLPKIKHIAKLRVYCAGENLWFWSARKGLDPRYSYDSTSTVSVYSPIRTISGGVQVTF
ncbi:MAG: SusC/RagA family TonB-linked outer membrane protein, partial [Alistipes sp.]|nr:SusC/RagA family TonB-linked outer membrane protein [Alistipes sp.]